jgi:hypothetical protein
MDRILVDSFDTNLKSAFRNFKFAILPCAFALCALPFALSSFAEAQQPAKIRSPEDLDACKSTAYQRTMLCRCRPISQKLMLLVETFMTFPFRLALGLK